MGIPKVTWEDVLTQIINESHLVTGDRLSAMVDRALRPWADRRGAGGRSRAAER